VGARERFAGVSDPGYGQRIQVGAVALNGPSGCPPTSIAFACP